MALNSLNLAAVSALLRTATAMGIVHSKAVVVVVVRDWVAVLLMRLAEKVK